MEATEAQDVSTGCFPVSPAGSQLCIRGQGCMQMLWDGQLARCRAVISVLDARKSSGKCVVLQSLGGNPEPCVYSMGDLPLSYSLQP